MKVLKVTGENIASLAGRFELDLEAGPLARAGLFAITGPTGAGKSSLLDAMCLALFDQTPRLMATKKVLVGADGGEQDRLQSDDVRSLLTRGCAEGWAQVEFLGVDGRRYASRWSVRRARLKVTGKLQKQDVSLRCVDTDEALGTGTRTKTLDEIKARLGLDFDQFRRSVFLAQGAFAEFLHASNKERGELLERMTGTTLYAQVSMAAYARAKQEREQLAVLAGQQGTLAVMDDEARAELDAAFEAARARVAELGERQQALREERAWHVRLGALGAGVAEARAELDGLLRTWATYEPAGWAARESVAAAEGDAGARPDAEGAEARLDAGEAQARPDVGEAQARPDVGEAQARLDAAKALDVRVRERDGALRKLADRSAVAVEAVRGLESKRVAAEAQVAACQERLDSAQAWLAERASMAPWAAEWGLAERELRAMVDALETGALLAAQRAQLDQALPAAQSRAGAAAEACKRADEALVGARGAVAEARQQHAAVDPQALRAARETVAQQLRTLDDLQQGLGRALTLAARVAQERERAHGAKEALARLEVDAAAARGRLETEGHARRRVEATLSLEARRADLKPGEACPLCGAEEHPYAVHAPAVAALLEESLAAEREAQARCDALSRGMGEQASALAGAERAAGQHEEERAALWAKLQALAAARDAELAAGWLVDAEAAAARHAGPPADGNSGPEPGGAPPASLPPRMLARRSELEAQAARVDTELARAQQLAQQLETARAAVDAAQAAVDTARGERELAQQALDALQAQQQRLTDDQARVAQALQRAKRELGSRVDPSEWEAALLASPAEFVAGLSQRVQAWFGKLASREAAERELPEKRAAVQGCQELLAAARAQQAELEAERKELASAQAQDVEARQAMFEGAATSDVEATLAALRAARVRAAERERSLASHRAEQPARVSELPATSAMSETADVSEMAQEGLAAGAPDAAAGLGAPEVAAGPEGTVGGDAAGEPNAGTELDGSPRALKALDELAARLSEQVTAAQERQSTLAQQRAVDDQQRRLKAELGPSIAAQRVELDRWERLNGLIGQADGAKFRDFAQGLTLQLVMAYANLQLRELRPRYQLAAVPGSNLDMQVVDRDMGDELRSIASLSGGETFLVSLALALGLAESMGGSGVVDSLFIDEGFGALDADAMEVALTALDALQASGRVVGLVSHVEGLAERVGVQVRVEPVGGGHSRVFVREVGA